MKDYIHTELIGDNIIDILNHIDICITIILHALPERMDLIHVASHRGLENIFGFPQSTPF